MFDKREVRLFIQAFDFLWAVRCHLHFVTGRPEERLTFDLQPEIARRMGYGDRGDTPSVERFMRRYFLIAKGGGRPDPRLLRPAGDRGVRRRSRRACRALLAPRRTARKPLDEPGFHDDGGRLSVDGPEVFETDPLNILRLFVIADRGDYDLHPDAFTAVDPLGGAGSHSKGAAR